VGLKEKRMVGEAELGPLPLPEMKGWLEGGYTRGEKGPKNPGEERTQSSHQGCSYAPSIEINKRLGVRERKGWERALVY